MKKKIGILTLHRAINYGAVWQCWALKHACEQLGYDVETIDYNPFGHYTYKGFLRHRPDKVLIYLRNFRYFNNFVDKMLNPTQHTENYDWIKHNPPKDDIYIVGSDTVWCESVVGQLLNSYMLEWAPNSVKRVSYAASLGGAYPQQEVFFNELKKFAAVAIREPQFADLLQDKRGGVVADVCDPSLLLSADDYIAVEKKKYFVPKHYIATFDLAGDNNIYKMAAQVKKFTNLPIVNLISGYSKDADVNYFGLTPQQWIYLIRNADYIITNSFHGTAFAIIFRRQFLTCQVTKGGRAKTNGRAENLLTQCGLLDQYVVPDKILQNLPTIDYSKVEDKIEYYRNRSLKWLERALQDETNK